MKRPFGVIVVAILMFIGAGLLALGCSAFFMLGAVAVSFPHGGPMSQLFSEMGIIGAGIFLVFAVAYVVLAISLIRLVYWARAASIVFILMGLLFAVIGILASLPHPESLVLAWQLFVIAVDGWILWYLTRPQVKDVFAARSHHFGDQARAHTQHRQDDSSPMVVQEMIREESMKFLAHMHLARLACAHGAQPYIVPMYFATDGNYLYSFSTVGQKIEWMRANPLVCVQADDVLNSQQWVSVIVYGTYEELSDAPEWRNARAFAYDLLQRKAMWWEPGYVKTILAGAQRPLVPVFYRIHIGQITGHRASLEPAVGIEQNAAD